MDDSRLERLLNDYMASVQQIEAKEKEGDGCVLLILHFAAGAFLSAFGSVAVFWLLLQIDARRFADIDYKSLIFGIAAVYTVFAIIQTIRSVRRAKRQHRELIQRISAQRPGFAEFYREYQRHKLEQASASVAARRAAMRDVVKGFVIGATVGTIVKGATDVRKDYRDTYGS